MSLLETASLIVTPNGYKEGKLYSVVPSDGSGDMSVTRATTATRVNAAGLVELVPYNLVLQSQTFENASWFKFGNASGLAPVITANAGAAPDGTLTADRFQFNSVGTTSSDRSILSQINISATIGSSYTMSFYVKAFAPSEVGKQLRIALEQGGISSVITLTSDYQRIVFTGVAVATTLNFLVETRGTFTTNTTADVLLWGAQVNEGSTALDYQATETRLNIPRLDYSNGSCPSLLVEPQRTNLASYSEQFDNANWFKEQASVTANTTTSPDGTQNADSLTENTANDHHLIYQGGTVSAGAYTQSVFIKKNTRQYAFLQIATDSAVNRYTIVVDLNNGSVTATSTAGSPTGTSNKIDSMGDGWYRLTVTATHTAGVVYTVFGLSDSANPTFSVAATPTYTGNGTGSIYIWGAQTEAGAYATSYIPTTSASVTRNADVISKTGITSLIGQTEGTIYLEADVQKHNESEFYVAISNGASLGEAIYLYQPSGGILQVLFRTGGVDQTISTLNANWNIGYNKIAIAYNSTSGEVFINGVSKGTVALSAIPTCSQLTLGARPDAPGSLVGSGGYKIATLWKTRLTNEQLELLTGDSFNTYAEMASYYNYTLQ